jgi:hypothetical protein
MHLKHGVISLFDFRGGKKALLDIGRMSVWRGAAKSWICSRIADLLS